MKRSFETLSPKSKPLSLSPESFDPSTLPQAENLIGFHCCDAEFLAGAQDGVMKDP